MGKLVSLKIGAGSFEIGFPVVMQLADEADDDNALTVRPVAELTGSLPPMPDLPLAYEAWRSHYRQLGDVTRLNAPKEQHTNVSRVAQQQACLNAAYQLSDRLNQWLQSAPFRPLREKWLETLHPTDAIRVLIQTPDAALRRLPWHVWDVLDRYPNAEVALSAASYERPPQPVEQATEKAPTVRILAILGDDTGLDVAGDRALLDQLPHSHVQVLVKPLRQDLTDQLWEQPWDILFFAGHSATDASGDTGTLAINSTEQLTLAELRYGLRHALAHGLTLAIFNSCDGLGLARELADLHIPQLVVMREPIPDVVAQTFLRYFLTAFSRGGTLYKALRNARERLQALEDRFVCATWLPVLVQNPAVRPPTWAQLAGYGSEQSSTPASGPVSKDLSPHPKRSALLKRWRGLFPIIPTGLSAAAGGAVLLLRLAGGLEALELAAFDQFMRWRPAESIDYRVLIVTIDQQEQQRFGNPSRTPPESITDEHLSRAIARLQTADPRVIGLDIYRDLPVDAARPELAAAYAQDSRIIGVCKGVDESGEGIAAPPNLPMEQVGFSDFAPDPHGVIRRQLVSKLDQEMDPEAPCLTTVAFSTQLAFRYLHGEPGEGGSAPHQLQEALLELIQRHALHHRGGYRYGDGGYQLLLNYRAHPQPFETVSLTNLLEGRVNPEAVRDRTVVLGVTAVNSLTGADDLHPTPLGQMPGVVVQAHMASQLVSAVLDRRSLLRLWQPAVETLWVVGWSLAAGLATVWMRGIQWGWRAIARLFFFFGAFNLTLIATSLLLFLIGFWVPVVPALMGGAIASTVIHLFNLLNQGSQPRCLRR
ncbi:MAG: CHASE2 domain-containing protein [Kaiparowitsia implicata GSE-PSE-MK54-09C]|jgi:CHASE2 domain-containing sensor protein|nr:CHASE2 domain-containing protein [Kaiparowitsia implicata GSE-PSE-MK54-09C]